MSIKEFLNKIDQLCIEYSISKLYLCLGYDSNNSLLYYIIMGVQNKASLIELFKVKLNHRKL